MFDAKQYHDLISRPAEEKSGGSKEYKGKKWAGTAYASFAEALTAAQKAYQQLSMIENEYKVDDPYELATEIATLKYREHKQKLLSEISSSYA